MATSWHGHVKDKSKTPIRNKPPSYKLPDSESYGEAIRPFNFREGRLLSIKLWGIAMPSCLRPQCVDTESPLVNFFLHCGHGKLISLCFSRWCLRRLFFACRPLKDFPQSWQWWLAVFVPSPDWGMGCNATVEPGELDGSGEIIESIEGLGWWISK
jgi:hypothetical protein